MRLWSWHTNRVHFTRYQWSNGWWDGVCLGLVRHQKQAHVVHRISLGWPVVIHCKRHNSVIPYKHHATTVQTIYEKTSTIAKCFRQLYYTHRACVHVCTHRVIYYKSCNFAISSASAKITFLDSYIFYISAVVDTIIKNLSKSVIRKYFFLQEISTLW